MLSIGNGAKNAFLFACPHPNEPIGSNLVHYLSEQLCVDEDLRTAFDYTWHLIPCVDPAGTRLNEGWFAGPFTPRNYARHFYRPASNQQVEWTFPVSHKELFYDRSIPETEMLMRVIDELQPEFLVGEDVRSGRLTALLPDYTHTPISMYAAYPHRRFLSPKVRSFVEHLEARFGSGTPMAPARRASRRRSR